MDFEQLRKFLLHWLSEHPQSCMDLWKSDDGCRAIQKRCNRVSVVQRFQVDEIDSAIADLDQLFTLFQARNWVLTTSLTLYRGERAAIGPQKGFVACSFDCEEAACYGCVAKVHVPSGTPWIPFYTEREILLPRGFLDVCKI